MTQDWMQSIDWRYVDEVDEYCYSYAKVRYVLPKDLKEEKLRENILYWSLENIWSLFKVYVLSPDMMRQIQHNMTEEDLRGLEHEIMIDCLIPRQCFCEQIENYLTYMRECVVQYEQVLKEDNSKQKLLRRLERQKSSMSYEGGVVSYVDNGGNMIDHIVI